MLLFEHKKQPGWAALEIIDCKEKIYTTGLGSNWNVKIGGIINIYSWAD